MASTYTSRIRLEKQADGENPNSWGLILNQNVIDLIDEAIAGYTVVSVSSIPVSLTSNDGSTDQSRNMSLELAGTLTADVTITIPSQEKIYFIRENTAGSFVTKIKTAGGSAVELTQSQNVLVACDGTEIYKVESPTSVSEFTANTLTATSVTTSIIAATDITTSIVSSTDITTSIVSATNGFIETLSATNITTTSAVSFVETSAGASNIVSFIAPASITTNYTLTLPVEDGSSNQALTTDGSGNLSFSSLYPQVITILTTGTSYSIPSGSQAILIRASGAGGGGAVRDAGNASSNGGTGGATTVSNATLGITISASGGLGGQQPESNTNNYNQMADSTTGTTIRAKGAQGSRAHGDNGDRSPYHGLNGHLVQQYITGSNVGGETLTYSLGTGGTGGSASGEVAQDGQDGYIEIWVW